MSNMDVPEDAVVEQGSADEAEVAATTEAILFASDKPLPPAKISEIGELGGVRRVRQAVETLNLRYERMGCAFRIVEIAGGYQMQTLPEYADVLARLVKSRSESRLSQAALETLAIVAYRQPVLRADIEAIRGVACGEVLRGLMEKNLVRIVGRADEIGRPMLYGTTKHFLEVFGLASLKDLPNAEQLRLPPGAAADDRAEETRTDDSAEATEAAEATEPAETTEATEAAETAETTEGEPSQPVPDPPEQDAQSTPASPEA